MTTITADGVVEKRLLGRRVLPEEIEAAVGGTWRVDGVVKYDGVGQYVLSHHRAYTERMPQNMAASRLLGKMVWGTVVLLVKGEEMS